MENDIDKIDGDTKTSGGVLENVADVIADVVTGNSLPAPIRRNAFKAFDRLCTAAIDVPVSWLEGVAAERRAETAARVKMLSTSGDQIANQMNIPEEYARVAVKKYGHRIVREQVNLDNITETAAKMIQAEASENEAQTADAPENELSDDWLNTFEEEARQKSSEEMRVLFARILAGEISKPSSFSIKTVKLLSQLDNEAATVFRKLCSLSISLRATNAIVDARVVSLNGNAASNSLQDFGLGFSALNTLHEYGLVISDYNSFMGYKSSVFTQDAKFVWGFTYQNRTHVLVPMEGWHPNNSLNVHGVALSKSGRELLQIVDIIPDDQYTKALGEYFENRKLTMTLVAEKQEKS